MKAVHTRHSVHGEERETARRVEDGVEFQCEVVRAVQEHGVVGQGVRGEQAPEVADHSLEERRKLILWVK